MDIINKEVVRIKDFFKRFKVAWSDHRREPLRFPGLRIIKTSLAVFVVLMLYLLLPETSNATTAAIAAIIAMRSSIRDSYVAAFIRLQSTFVGAVFGLIILQLKEMTKLEYDSLPYNLLLALFVLLVMWISVSFLRSDGAVLGSIVLLVIAIGPILDMSPLQAAITRFLDTLIGVVVALLVNRVLPLPQTEEDKEQHNA
ncbi:MAG: aromatic acid exporter family protein [Eubacteriales bacterium]|nr:aromatic acid exporter family protein [Eubacteriales bacterium]